MTEDEDTKRREDIWGVFKAMHDGDHLKAQQILADGGWCAPSSTIYGHLTPLTEADVIDGWPYR